MSSKRRNLLRRAFSLAVRREAWILPQGLPARNPFLAHACGELGSPNMGETFHLALSGPSLREREGE